MYFKIESENGALVCGKLKINMNEKVRVRVSDAGWKRFNQRMATEQRMLPARLRMERPPQDADGYTEWVLWQLMEAFGEQCYNGNPEPPFMAIELKV